jgi:hypothetical protein
LALPVLVRESVENNAELDQNLQRDWYLVPAAFRHFYWEKTGESVRISLRGKNCLYS